MGNSNYSSGTNPNPKEIFVKGFFYCSQMENSPGHHLIQVLVLLKTLQSGVNGLTDKLPKHKLSHCLAALSPPQKIGRLNFSRIPWKVRQERHDLKANFSLL